MLNLNPLKITGGCRNPDRGISRLDKHKGSLALFSLISFMVLVPQSVNGQGLPGGSSGLTPITLNNQIAQVTPPPQFIPTDVTPFTVVPERNIFNPGYKFRLFQELPTRLWFNAFTEVSQRLDTNVLFTYSNPKADYAFRVLPNLTVGYEVFKNTSIYANYFLIKDVFARNYSDINFPTTQSVSWGLRHVSQLGARTTLQYDFQARELWQTSHLHQFDFLPGLTLTHVFSPRNIVYASTLLQLRGGDYFVAPTREIDPFYTVGYIHRKGLWTFIATDTLVTNFRHPPFNDAVPNQSNVTMIADIELNHPVSRKFNGLLAFLRAEPIWNWDSNKVAGLSGFDFRFYGGLRLALNKPSYYSAVENIRKQAMRGGDQQRGQYHTPMLDLQPETGPHQPDASDPETTPSSNNQNNSQTNSQNNSQAAPLPLH